MATQLRRRGLFIGAGAAALVGVGIYSSAVFAIPNRPGSDGQSRADVAARDERVDKLIERLAANLKIDERALRSALIKTDKELVDDAIKAGRLTTERGDEIKKRIDQSDGESIFRRAGPGHPHGAPMAIRQTILSTAADYLGLSVEQLRSELQQGRSLADVTKDKNKDVSTLKSKLLSALSAKIDEGVQMGIVPKERAATMKANLERHVEMIVNRTFDRGPGRPVRKQ